MAVSEKTALEQDWILLRERAVAWLRVAFAAVAVAVIYLNPSRVARFPSLSIDMLWSFFLYSTVVLFFVTKTRFGTTRVGAITTMLDVFWIAVIVYSTGGTNTPFFFYYSFPVITASVLWGIKGSLPVALVAVSAYFVIRLSLAGGAGSDPIEFDTIVVRSFYLIVLAGIFGYISEFEKKQNQKLLALSHTAGQVAALQERRRIMYELHDGILQSLATLIIRLEACRSRTSHTESELDRDLRDIEDLTRSSMKEIRQFLAGKDTQPLIHGTLAERVRDELRFLRDELEVRAILETEPEELDLSPDVEREVYYVLREGLTNITRHSHAARAEIYLHQVNETLEGTLMDDGVGMNLQNSREARGVGLNSMKERIEKLGGELEIDSSPGSGTKITFSLPLGPSRKAVVNN